jgi:hypothetical protein
MKVVFFMLSHEKVSESAMTVRVPGGSEMKASISLYSSCS